MNVLQVICFIGNDIPQENYHLILVSSSMSIGLFVLIASVVCASTVVSLPRGCSLLSSSLRSSTFHLITSLHSTSTSTSTTFISNFHNIQHSYTNIRSDLNIIASTPAPNIEQQNADRDTTFSFGRMSERGFGVLASGPESTSHAPRHPSSTNSYSLRDSSASHVRLWRGWWRWDGETKKQKAEPRHSPH